VKDGKSRLLKIQKNSQGITRGQLEFNIGIEFSGNTGAIRTDTISKRTKLDQGGSCVI